METLTLKNPYPDLITNAGINQLLYVGQPEILVAADTALGLHAWRGDNIIWQRSFATGNDKIRPTMRIRDLAEQGRALYVAVGDQVVILDTLSGRMIWQYTPPRAWGFLITSPLCIAADEHGFVAGFDNGSVGTWNPDGLGERIRSFNDAPRWIGLASDEIIGCDGFAISTFSREALRSKSRFRLSDRVYDFALSPDKGTAAVLTIHAVELWSIVSQTKTLSLNTSPGRPSIAFSPDGEFLVIAEFDRIRWVSLTGGSIVEQRGFETTPLSLTFKPSGQSLIVGGSDGEIRIAERP